MSTRTMPDERETIIQYDDGRENANIYTHDKALMRHIEHELGIKPYRTHGLAREYEIPKKWLRLPRKPSQRRSEASRRLALQRGGVGIRKNRKAAPGSV